MKRLLLLAACVAFPLFGQELRLDPVLHGGHDALIAIDALPAGAEEWEAFLSVDGGAHYAVRITPHLDASIRSYSFRVPNVAARDARVLLRTGDEVHERIVMVPRSFTIDADFARIDSFSGAPTEERGESARFDDDHVVEWRDAGREMRHRDSSGFDPVECSIGESPETAAPVSVCTFAAAPRLISRIASLRRTPSTFRAVARDTLLLSTRLNV
ncbi:MAG TPA: hypothetical protein VH087_10655 [Thermoanaerobaculia bacterium]|nr:hypothetical protein [Thermoanaerobaculia bacterium]